MMSDTTKDPENRLLILAKWLTHAKESVFMTLKYIITRLFGMLYSTSVAINY
jgi:hypothetical protein